MKGLSKTYKKKSYKKRRGGYTKKVRRSIKRRGKGKKRIEKGGADENPVESSSAEPVQKPVEEPATSNTTDVVKPDEAKPEKERSMRRGFNTVANELLKNGLSKKTFENLINNDQLKGDLSKTASKYNLGPQNISSQIRTKSNSYVNSTRPTVSPDTASSGTITTTSYQPETENPEVEELRNQLTSLQKDYQVLVDKVRNLQAAN